nr:transposon Ty3-I Gag-Pol polyprotein [Tanacetum cinerariifolium]
NLPKLVPRRTDFCRLVRYPGRQMSPGKLSSPVLLFVVVKTSLRHVVDLVYLPGKKNVQANRMVEEVQATHEVVRANIIKANAKYKIATDKHRRKKLFQIGDERGNEEDMIKELSKEYMDHLERDKSKGTNMSNVSAKHK